MISSTGPSGNTLLSRLLDLSNLAASPFRLWLVLTIGKKLGQLIGEWESLGIAPKPYLLPLKLATQFKDIPLWISNLNGKPLLRERITKR